MDREQMVRERAYQIWDAEGRPLGREQEHWDRAVREIDEQVTEPSVNASGTSEPVQAAPAAVADEPTEGSASSVPAARPKRAARTSTKPSAAPSPRTKAGKKPA